jgi:putative heme iron utilization protein
MSRYLVEADFAFGHLNISNVGIQAVLAISWAFINPADIKIHFIASKKKHFFKIYLVREFSYKY